MSRVPLHLRVVAVVVAALLVVVVAGAAVLVAADRTSAIRRDVDRRLQPAAGDARALARALVDQETGERGFLITGDRSFLAPYDVGRTQERRRVAQLREAFVDDPALLRRIDQAEDAARTWRRVGPGPEVRAREAGRTGLAQRLVATGTGRRAFDEVRRVQEALLADIEQRVVQAEDSAAAAERTLRDVLLTSSLVLLLLLVGIGLLLRRWLLVPVGTLRRSLRRVAAGDLTARVTTQGPPEVVAIASDAEAMRRRLVEELDTSRAAVEALEQQTPVVAGMRGELSAEPLRHLGGLTVAGVLRPMEGVLAGDWWQAVQRPSGAVALMVADVSGHGATAGLVALRFQQRLLTLLRTDLDLLRAFTIAAADLDHDPERFLTCLVVEVDVAGGTLLHVNAGHPPALLVRRGAHPVAHELAPTGPVVSVLGGEWDAAVTPFGDDDLLLALTDGVLESRSADGTELGQEGVLRALRDLDDWSPQAAVAEVDAAVRAFTAGARQDDVTVVAARRTAFSRGGEARRG
ncbi:PP2C family protein-serine/threonine phosphatase [Nocardioides marmoribigeumensis]|uniref:Sigma-B regulation protein RsbU (Phosphoserine phosphatase) n=1 Tax=Nocardioides marmoribigeumensis TaxID=433649 RepID=A0ABU2BQU7_9ACTN|nr:SpoIIE family protein phosphatase [Nocardioides marmoribigeumensis]MDR7360999.1 sigma-B regulation protein RsbU (phosphoserine phosphatase) [Nocardioides marmoribigeumensis]